MTDEELAKVLYHAWCGHDPIKENWSLYSFLNDYDGEVVKEAYLEMARAAREALTTEDGR